jgi:hypothetical protein
MENREGSLVIDGVTVEPGSGDRRAWIYVPVSPDVERGPGGTPMLTVIEAGPTAFLQCTVRVALREEVLARTLARLKEIEPQADTLAPAPLSVERIALEIRSEAGWVSIADSKGSGMAPWTAALAAPLTPEQLAAIKSAAAGDRGHARLCARLLLTGPPGSFRRWETMHETTVRTATGTASASFTAAGQAASRAGDPTLVELGADLADALQTHDVRR